MRNNVRIKLRVDVTIDDFEQLPELIGVGLLFQLVLGSGEAFQNVFE